MFVLCTYTVQYSLYTCLAAHWLLSSLQQTTSLLTGSERRGSRPTMPLVVQLELQQQTDTITALHFAILPQTLLLPLIFSLLLQQ